ncbi:MAG: hypothetical protein ACXWIM_09600, partial [Burkholderiales bacterium]
ASRPHIPPRHPARTLVFGAMFGAAELKYTLRAEHYGIVFSLAENGDGYIQPEHRALRRCWSRCIAYSALFSDVRNCVIGTALACPP